MHTLAVVSLFLAEIRNVKKEKFNQHARQYQLLDDIQTQSIIFSTKIASYE